MLLSNLFQKYNFRLEETCSCKRKFLFKFNDVYMSEGVLYYLIDNIQMYLHFESTVAVQVLFLDIFTRKWNSIIQM